jgi:hypothetical protein
VPWQLLQKTNDPRISMLRKFAQGDEDFLAGPGVVGPQLARFRYS